MGTTGAARSTPRTWRWQWTLSNGGTVAAVIDRDANTEVITQGARFLSRSARGAKPEGHTVMVDPERLPDASDRPGVEAVITFAPTAAVCILRVDGQEVAPSAWPVRPPTVTPEAPRPYGAWVLVGLGALALVVFGLVVRATRSEPPHVDSKIGGMHRAPNGLFIAHYPDDFEARPAVLPPGVGGVVLTDTAKMTAIVVGATLNPPSETTDPWVLQQRLHDEAVVNLPKGTARYEEGTRSEETCLGRPGAVVTGRIKSGSKATARVWSCTFFHEAAGYIALYMLAEPAGTADVRRARSIIDSTELTRLADLGPLPPGLLPTDPLGSGSALPLGSPPLDSLLPR